MEWKSVILVNANAGNAQGLHKWDGIKKILLEKLPSAPVLITESAEESNSLVHELMDKGYTCFLGAGGDGTIHSLLNSLMNHPGLLHPGIAIGGIGLGSSNDFHKPYKDKINTIPLRINQQKAALHDVGQVIYTDFAGKRVKKYFIINASLGITAKANWLFNQKDAFISFTKTQLTGLAIVYTALKTIASFSNFYVQINSRQYNYQGLAANIAILKNPHVSGSFCYDQCIGHQDNFLGVSVCENLSRLALIRTLVDLSRGRFAGKKGRTFVKTQRLCITTHGLVPLETDGEVTVGKDFEFSVLPSAIYILME